MDVWTAATLLILAFALGMMHNTRKMIRTYRKEINESLVITNREVAIVMALNESFKRAGILPSDYDDLMCARCSNMVKEIRNNLIKESNSETEHIEIKH